MEVIEGRDFLYIPVVPLHFSANSSYGSGSFGSLLMTKELFAVVPFKIKDPRQQGIQWIQIDGRSPVEWIEMFLEQGTFDLNILNRFIRKLTEKVSHSHLLEVSKQLKIKIRQGWFGHSIRFKTLEAQRKKFQVFPIKKAYTSHCIRLYRDLPNFQA